MGRTITVIPGDGIGPAVTAATLEVLRAAGAELEFDEQLAGMEAVAKLNDPIPEPTLASVRRNRVVLKGPLATPSGSGFRSINVAPCKEFDLYVNVRPVRTIMPRGALRGHRPRADPREHRGAVRRGGALHRARGGSQGRRRERDDHHPLRLGADLQMRLRVRARQRPEEGHARTQGEHPQVHAGTRAPRGRALRHLSRVAGRERIPPRADRGTSATPRPRCPRFHGRAARRGRERGGCAVRHLSRAAALHLVPRGCDRGGDPSDTARSRRHGAALVHVRLSRARDARSRELDRRAWGGGLGRGVRDLSHAERLRGMPPGLAATRGAGASRARSYDCARGRQPGAGARIPRVPILRARPRGCGRDAAHRLRDLPHRSVLRRLPPAGCCARPAPDERRRTDLAGGADAPGPPPMAPAAAAGSAGPARAAPAEVPPAPAASRPSFHPGDFALRHASAAYGQTMECTNCHSVEAFCKACHGEAGLAPATRAGPGFHGGGAAWLLGHGQPARQGLESCASCHRQNDCVRCHSTIGSFRVDPHGPSFDAARGWARAPETCLVCHLQKPL